MSIGHQLLNVPMGDMIRQMAFAIADAQVELDESSIEVAEMMGGLKTVYDDEGNSTFDDSRVFFGYDYMTIKEAEAYLSVDDALSGGNLSEALTKLKEANGVASNASDDTEIKVPLRVSMLELGYSPTFYQFIDTIIEVKIAIKFTRTSEYSRSFSKKQEEQKRKRRGRRRRRTRTNTVTTTQVDASYSSKYSYSAEGASLLRTKLSPLPPPPILEERINDLMEMENARREAKRAAEAGETPAPA